MNSEKQKQEIAQTFLASCATAIGSAEIRVERRCCLEPAGKSLISGEAIGADAVVERAKLIVSYGLTFTLKHILYGPHGVALSLHNTARRGDLILDEHLATVCSLRDGKIFAINSYLSDIDMVNAFFV